MNTSRLARTAILLALISTMSGCSVFEHLSTPENTLSPSLVPQGATSDVLVTFNGALLRFSAPSEELDSRLQLSAAALADSPAMSLDEATRFVGGDSVYSKVHRFQVSSTTLEPGRVELMDIGYLPKAGQSPLQAKIGVRIETAINADHAGKPVVAHVKVDHIANGGAVGAVSASAENWQEMAAGDFQILTWRNAGDLYVLALRMNQAG